MGKLYERLDNAPQSTNCGQFLPATSFKTPSAVLRGLFSDLLQSQTMRSFIPALVYRFQRCNDDDVIAISNFLTKTQIKDTTVHESDALASTMLHKLIVVSELWRTPTESYNDLKAAFMQTLVGSNIAPVVHTYCIASGGSDPNCAEEIPLQNDYKLQYPRDAFYDAPISIPNGSSALLLSGLLDPQTVSKYARYQYDSFIGSAKRLIEFNYSVHATIANTHVMAKLVASFVQVDGDVTLLNTSCVAEVAPMTFQIPTTTATNMLATTDIYDGKPTEMFNKSSTGQPMDEASSRGDFVSAGYRVATIVGFALSGVLAVALVVVLRRQQLRTADNHAAYVEPVV
ncbi:serine protease family S33 [Achlya hypogyna]|uniref:Serine protease family S33 n=1 Tax=Achlya hypogyna TaxID=1202772 RepID=A0A1V9YIV8_ACHHY|nr:serine protease family S33 [Achlya hypogyna]